MKDFLKQVTVFVIVILVLYGLSLSARPSEEELLERKIEQEMYEHEIWQEGFDYGYGQAEWELEGEIKKAYEEGSDYGYVAGYERGYIQCLKDNNMEWKIDKFLDSK